MKKTLLLWLAWFSTLFVVSAGWYVSYMHQEVPPPPHRVPTAVWRTLIIRGDDGVWRPAIQSEYKSEWKQSADKFADFAPTTEKLSVVYAEMNDEFFFGNLPVGKTTIQLGDLSALNDLGHIYQRNDGTWVIVVDRSSHVVERQAEMTLVHEMCHQETMIAKAKVGLDGHSYAFEACMRSIANQGGFKDLW